MAVLSQLPEQAIISSLKGAIDFYLWKGIAVARKWPVFRTREKHPAEAANQQTFAYAAKAFKQLPPFIQQQYNRMAVGTPWSGKDLFMRSYLSGIPY